MLRYTRRLSHGLSLLVFVIASLAFAAWFVVADVAASGPWFVSPTGNDANSCLAYSTPCRTISAAIGKASAGDIIIIASGLYTESLTLDKNLTLIGFGSDATFLSMGDGYRVLEVSAGSKVNAPAIKRAPTNKPVMARRCCATSCRRARQTASGSMTSVNSDNRWIGLHGPHSRIS